MNSEIAKHFTDTHLTVLGLLLFVLSFSLILVIAFKGRRKETDQLIQMLPLEENHERSI